MMRLLSHPINQGNKLIVLLSIIAASVFNLSAQVRVGEWRDHFSYRNGLLVTPGPNKVYVASSNGIFWFDQKTRALGKISTVNGLSDIGVSALAHSPSEEILLVGYENGNIDILFTNRTVNIPHIRTKLMQGSKRINGITFVNKERVLISTGFGIVDLNIARLEISDTYFIGSSGDQINVSSTTIHQGEIVAATEVGILKAPLDHPNLIHFAVWEQLQHPSANTRFSAIASVGDRLYVVESTGAETLDQLWVLGAFGWQAIWNQYNTISSLSTDGSQLLFCSRQGIGIIPTADAYPAITSSYPNINGFNPNNAVFLSNGGLAVADHANGLVIQNNGEWIGTYPNGPYNNNAFYINFLNDDVLVAAGTRTSTWNSTYQSTLIHRMSNERWSFIYDQESIDPIRILPNPNSNNEFFVANWGSGIGLYREGRKVEQFDQDNSTLEATLAEGPFCRVSGIATDRAGNLWAVNSGVSNTLSVRLTDGRWVGFPYRRHIGSDRTDNIAISASGYLWMNIPTAGGFFVVDPGPDPSTASDDIIARVQMIDREGSSLPNDIHSMAFDQDGYLWIGTTRGVLVSYNPENVFQPEGFFAQQIKIPAIVEGMAEYLLDSETVTSIAIDGGNRKWFGTSQSGVYQYSPDGYTNLKHFNVGNSPLPSNVIQHINIHPKTGEIFIATDKGLVSYRGDANTPGETFGKIYAFPNPIRPDYTGDITITGLVRNTIVKITDSTGNLVFETKSQGGQATWDGTNLRGNRVATGVYLIFCADEKGEQSAVGKLMFIK